MALIETGILPGEVRVDPADGLEYRFVTDTWVRNTAEVLEPLASSEGFPIVNVTIGELAVDKNTGVNFRWDGATWNIVSTIVGVGSSVTSGEIATGAVTAAKLAAGSVETAKIANDAVTSEKIVAGAVGSSELSVGVLQIVQVTIPSADVLALFTTPATLVAAPGAGKAIRVENIIVGIDFNTAAYDTHTTMEFRYTNGSGTKVSADNGSLAAAADNFTATGAVEAAA